jgi:Zn-dependent protease
MDIQSLIFIGIIIIISLSLHEYAHAWMADRLGDPTPRMQWRLTPNPLVHIDPIWFLMIFIIHFGWGKPVITNPAYFRDPVKGDFLVAMAWPITNIILAIIGGIIMMVYGRFIWMESAYSVLQAWDLVLQFWLLFMSINISLAVFNLLPLYPLDGYRIIKIISPSAWHRMERNGQILQIAVLILILWPGRNIIGNIISVVSEKLMSVIFIVLSQVFY